MLEKQTDVKLKTAMLLAGCLWFSGPGLAEEPLILSSWEVRTGGDVVDCGPGVPPTNAELIGLYSLDFLTLLKQPWAGPHSVNDSLRNIGEQLRSKLPLLAVSFDEFVEMIDNADLNEARVWLPTARLKDLKDEGLLDLGRGLVTSDPTTAAALDLTTLPPAGCEKPGSPGEYNVLQAVIRNQHKVNGQIIYEYDEALLDRLRLDPLQHSLLLVHEWLWDFLKVDEVRQLRRVNALLHSRDLHGMTAEALWDALQNNHFDAADMGPRPGGPPLRLLRVSDKSACFFKDATIHCWGSGFGSHSSYGVRQLKDMAMTRDTVCAVDGESVVCFGARPEILEGLGKVRHPVSIVSRYAFTGYEDFCLQTLYDGIKCTREEPFFKGIASPVDEIMYGHADACLFDDGALDCSRGPHWSGLTDAVLTDVGIFGVKDGIILDDGTKTDAVVYLNDLAAATGKTFSRVEGAFGFVCGLTATHEVLCRDNDPEQTSAYERVPTFQGVDLLAAGQGVVCAQDRVGVRCWGKNASGALEVPWDLYPINPGR